MLTGTEKILLIFDSISTVVLLIAVFMVLGLVKKLYGGRFTSILPTMAAGTFLLFVKEALESVLLPLYPGVDLLPGFEIGLQTFQLVAGLFYLSAFYQFYQIRYATSGFFEKR